MTAAFEWGKVVGRRRKLLLGVGGNAEGVAHALRSPEVSLRVLVDHEVVGPGPAKTPVQPERVPEPLAVGDRGAHVGREGLDFASERRENANRPDPDPLVPGLVSNRARAQPSEQLLAQFACLRSKGPQGA